MNTLRRENYKPRSLVNIKVSKHYQGAGEIVCWLKAMLLPGTQVWFPAPFKVAQTVNKSNSKDQTHPLLASAYMCTCKHKHTNKNK